MLFLDFDVLWIVKYNVSAARQVGSQVRVSKRYRLKADSGIRCVYQLLVMATSVASPTDGQRWVYGNG